MTDRGTGSWSGIRLPAGLSSMVDVDIVVPEFVGSGPA